MRNLFFTAVCVVLFIPPCIYAQTSRIDSLLQVYSQQPDDTSKMFTLTHLINAYMYRAPEQSMVFAREKLRLASTLDFKKGESLANFHMGVLQQNLDQYDSARIYYSRAFDLAAGINDTMRMVLAVDGLAGTNLKMGNFAAADSLNDFNIAIFKHRKDHYRLATTYASKSQVNKEQGNYNIAYKYAMEALKLIQEFDKPIRRADILYQLVIIEQELGHIPVAIAYSREALQIYREHGDLMYQALSLGKLGDLFVIQGNYNEALAHFQESIVMADSAGNLTVKAATLNSLGNLYILQDQYDKARTELDDALEITSRTGDLPGKVKTLNTMGVLMNTTNNPQQAIQKLNESIRIAEQLNLRPDQSNAHLERSRSHEDLGMMQAALSDYKIHKQLSDSIFASEKMQQIEELRIIYETEKKDQEIEIQKIQIELLAQKEQNYRNRILLLTILLVLFVITVFMVQMALRQQLKRRRLEHETTNQLLEIKKREFTTQILHIAQKNELLLDLKAMVRELKSEGPNSSLQKQIINKINIDINNERSWERFQKYFEDLHKGFDDKIRNIAPDISKSELRLIALLKMNLNSQEIASVLNISQEGIKKARYRVRKKLGLETADSLEDFLGSLRYS
jgi:tetratricopeptide (TPR) repeat protein